MWRKNESQIDVCSWTGINLDDCLNGHFIKATHKETTATKTRGKATKASE